MNIIKKKDEIHEFNEVDMGGLFECHGQIFMKMVDVCFEEGIYNAICLEDGKLSHFFSESKVQFVNADLIIH